MPRHMDPRNRKHTVEGVRLTDSELDELRRRVRGRWQWWFFQLVLIVAIVGSSMIGHWVTQLPGIAPNRLTRSVVVGGIGAFIAGWGLFASHVMLRPLRLQAMEEMGLLDAQDDASANTDM